MRDHDGSGAEPQGYDDVGGRRVHSRRPMSTAGYDAQRDQH